MTGSGSAVVAVALVLVVLMLLIRHPALALREEPFLLEEADGEQQGQNDEQGPPVEEDLQNIRVRLVFSTGSLSREVGVVGVVAHVIGSLEYPEDSRDEQVVGSR